jgi:hypothetical protein
MILVRLLPQLRQFRALQVFRRCCFRSHESDFQERNFPTGLNRATSSAFLTPNPKHPFRFTHRSETCAQFFAQPPARQGFVFLQELSARSSNALIRQLQVHETSLARMHSKGNTFPLEFTDGAERSVKIED